MRKFIVLTLTIFLVFTLTSCANDNVVGEKKITCKDIIEVYEESNYEIFHEETTNQDYKWNCCVKCTAPDSDDYIYFYFFNTNEEAVNYSDGREWNILLYIFSELFGDASWLETKTYNNIAIEYDQEDLYEPFKSLL